MNPRLPVALSDVIGAARSLAGDVVRTPTTRSQALSELTGADVLVKFENLQYTGSFKERGALAKLRSLTEDEKRRGVVCMSAGNHAQAVAYHAARLQISATVVVPERSSFSKVARTRALGAEVLERGRSLEEAAGAATALAAQRGLTVIHPFDDPVVIAGQGTVALELLEDQPDLDMLIVPAGGGGLIAGMAVVAKSFRPAVEVVGVQSMLFPSFAAPASSPAASPGAGYPTIADGIAVSTPGLLTKQIIDELVDAWVTVPEATIEKAVAVYLEREKVVAEGAGAAGLAAMLDDPDRFRGRRVGLVVSGGNIDLQLLSTVITRSLIQTGRLTVLRTSLSDVPGSLAELTAMVSEYGGNIVEVTHRHRDLEFPARSAIVELTVETFDEDHGRRLRDVIERGGAPRASG